MYNRYNYFAYIDVYAACGALANAKHVSMLLIEVKFVQIEWEIHRLINTQPICKSDHRLRAFIFFFYFFCRIAAVLARLVFYCR